MNIYAEAGTKVVFTGEGAFDHEREQAHDLLTVNKQYTVASVDVGSWISYVTLEEFPGEQFNTVLFSDVDPDSK